MTKQTIALLTFFLVIFLTANLGWSGEPTPADSPDRRAEIDSLRLPSRLGILERNVDALLVYFHLNSVMPGSAADSTGKPATADEELKELRNRLAWLEKVQSRQDKDRLEVLDVRLAQIAEHMHLQPLPENANKNNSPPATPTQKMDQLEKRYLHIQNSLAQTAKDLNSLIQNLEVIEVGFSDGRSTPPDSEPGTTENAPPPAEIAKTGRCILVNWTPRRQQVIVNGSAMVIEPAQYVWTDAFHYTVQPSRTEVSVPLGEVVAYLPRHEFPKHWSRSFWRWTGTDYAMEIAVRE